MIHSNPRPKSYDSDTYVKVVCRYLFPEGTVVGHNLSRKCVFATYVGIVRVLNSYKFKWFGTHDVTMIGQGHMCQAVSVILSVLAKRTMQGAVVNFSVRLRAPALMRHCPGLNQRYLKHVAAAC